MSMFIELTLADDGEKKIINIDTVETIYVDEDAETIVVRKGRDYFRAEESYEEIKAMLNEAGKILCK